MNPQETFLGRQAIERVLTAVTTEAVSREGGDRERLDRPDDGKRP